VPRPLSVSVRIDVLPSAASAFWISSAAEGGVGWVAQPADNVASAVARTSADK
jgi:hypothetical protein